jgi:hypothetical protein
MRTTEPVQERSGVNLPPFTEVQEKAIKASQREDRSIDTDKLRSALSDYVRSAILDPWFAEINDTWQQPVKRLDAAADTLIARLQELRRTLAATRPRDLTIDVNSVGRIITGVQDARKSAAALRLSVPQDETWWRTVAGKRFVVSDIAETAARSIKGFVTSHASLIGLTEDLEKARATHQTLVTSLQDQQNRTREEIEALTKQIGQRVKPLEFVAPHPDLIVKGLPLLLGVVIGGLLFWNAQCEHRLVASRRLLSASREGETGRDLSQMLAGCDTDRLPWLWLTVGSVAWVGVSGVVLACFAAASLLPVILMTILGSVIVIASTRRRKGRINMRSATQSGP